MKFVCPVCGYVHEGDTPPEKCPLCGVPGAKFIKVEGVVEGIVDSPIPETPGPLLSVYPRV